MGSRTVRREALITDRLAVGSKFDKYHPEDAKEVRTAEVRPGKVGELKVAWKNYKFEMGWWTIAPDMVYRKALEAIKDVHYSARDVEAFAVALSEFQHEFAFAFKAGVLLSALINKSDETRFFIPTHHLDTLICCLGYRNTKNIIVNGNLSAWTGQSMQSGKIIVNGNVDNGVGKEMEGGSITVNGNAAEVVGWSMKGGEIHLNGGYEGIAGDVKGKIFHRGKLVVDVR